MADGFSPFHLELHSTSTHRKMLHCFVHGFRSLAIFWPTPSPLLLVLLLLQLPAPCSASIYICCVRKPISGCHYILSNIKMTSCISKLSRVLRTEIYIYIYGWHRSVQSTLPTLRVFVHILLHAAYDIILNWRHCVWVSDICYCRCIHCTKCTYIVLRLWSWPRGSYVANGEWWGTATRLCEMDDTWSLATVTNNIHPSLIACNTNKNHIISPVLKWCGRLTTRCVTHWLIALRLNAYLSLISSDEWTNSDDVALGDTFCGDTNKLLVNEGRATATTINR